MNISFEQVICFNNLPGMKNSTVIKWLLLALAVISFLAALIELIIS